MNNRYPTLILILLLLGLIIFIDLPNSPGIHIGSLNKPLDIVLGLDLQGGMQVLLEAKVPEGSTVEAQAMEDTKTILENRTNGLGVSEVIFQVAGNNRIVGEFPGLTNTEEVLAVLKETGQLEFVDFDTNPPAPGTVVRTDLNVSETENTDERYHTVLTGDQLKTVAVTQDQLGEFVITFELKSDAAATFSDYTRNNINTYLGIVLDKKVISSPIISNQISDGRGLISGGFTLESANTLAIQLRYGSLPVALEVVETRVIGPTLGEESLQKSLIAGLIGFAIVVLFMAIYYRLPGIVANFSIIYYAFLTLALFKFIPVTLTLPGIAGFLLSTGGALDANILIFERMKEELRSGRTVDQAFNLGFQRAWSSIRDSNAATLITSAILFWFGSAYGATFVKGFAVTLALGVLVSLFTSIVVTRNLLAMVIGLIKNPDKHSKWFGL